MAKVNLESCIKTAKEIAEDLEYKLKAARDPKKKRLAQTSFDYWTSVAEHLENYQKTIS